MHISWKMIRIIIRGTHRIGLNVFGSFTGMIWEFDTRISFDSNSFMLANWTFFPFNSNHQNAWSLPVENLRMPPYVSQRHNLLPRHVWSSNNLHIFIQHVKGWDFKPTHQRTLLANFWLFAFAQRNQLRFSPLGHEGFGNFCHAVQSNYVRKLMRSQWREW